MKMSEEEDADVNWIEDEEGKEGGNEERDQRNAELSGLQFPANSLDAVAQVAIAGILRPALMV